MARDKKSLVCLSSITLSEPRIKGKTVTADITIQHRSGDTATFPLMLNYENSMVRKDHIPLLRLACCMPLLNYGLFTEKMIVNFPLATSDLQLLTDLNVVFSKDIFVNKILRRRTNYILPEYIPDEKIVTPKDAHPKAVLQCTEVCRDEQLSEMKNSPTACGVLSSGGKESLLTYGMLKELGARVYPLYVNESGGHWRTALTAYRYHKKTDNNTRRVWSNVDRFYTFMLDNLSFIRPDHRQIQADTYPLRLCIFPFYVFAFFPVLYDEDIGNILIGSEFDDERSTPLYHGIRHYFGVYDQHQDFDLRMHDWYAQRMPGICQWSAVRTISGLIVERILVNRYPELAQLQRSCHSCHFHRETLIPCGHCSKCNGVLLFLLANKNDPKIMAFRVKDIERFRQQVHNVPLRLDQDEKEHSLLLLTSSSTKLMFHQPSDHVEQIHVRKQTSNLECLPVLFRKGIMNIIDQYTTGYCQLKEGKWISVSKQKS
jgi:hypothetical protein